MCGQKYPLLTCINPKVISAQSELDMVRISKIDQTRTYVSLSSCYMLRCEKRGVCVMYFGTCTVSVNNGGTAW